MTSETKFQNEFLTSLSQSFVEARTMIAVFLSKGRDYRSNNTKKFNKIIKFESSTIEFEGEFDVKIVDAKTKEVIILDNDELMEVIERIEMYKREYKELQAFAAREKKRSQLRAMKVRLDAINS